MLQVCVPLSSKARDHPLKKKKDAQITFFYVGRIFLRRMSPLCYELTATRTIG